MLSANAFQDALLDEIGPEGSQGPAAIGQTQFVGRLLSKLENPLTLSWRDPGRNPSTANLMERGEPGLVKGMQIGIDGIGMRLERRRNINRGQPGGIQGDGFGPTALRAREAILR